MDVRDYRLEDTRVVARVADAAGEREVVLVGEAAARVLAVARAAGAETRPVAYAILVELRPRRELRPVSHDASFWSAIYRAGQDGWELARAAPPLRRWVGTQDLRGVSALVLGCGRGHEARLLAEAGATVAAVDFAPEAIAAAREICAGLPVELLEMDLFALPGLQRRWQLVLEHCCFCAIDPARRDEYVDVVAALADRLVGLYWAHDRPGGPPFATSREELEVRLGRRLRIEGMEVPGDSVAARRGQELLLSATSRSL